MASQLDKVFTADPKSVYEIFLSKGTVGFYIPAYQREYSWDEGSINRLLEDICSGICSFSEHDDAITFIGTVISILDTDHKTIKPYIHGELPSEVMSVIDGQQRLTTLALIAVCLYQTLSEITYKFEKFPGFVKDWVLNQVNPLLNKLKQILEIDRFSSDQEYRYYPKITRAYWDQWSTNKDSVFYKSPIASYLFGFIQHIHTFEGDRPKSKFNYQIPEEVEENEIAKHQRIKDNLQTIFKRIDLVIKNNGDETYRFPDLEQVLSDEKIQTRLLNRVIPNDWFEEIKSLGDKHVATFRQTIRTLIFTQFYLDRIAVTSVVATNETYAFDMFEALNTTGEPLTAFETFKPKVIDLEDIKNYENSDSRKFIDAIDKTLDRYKKAEEKQSATTRLLRPFRLAFEGESLSKHLSDQRRFLNKSFDSLSNVDSQKDFVKRLYEMSIFIEACWPEKKADLPSGEHFKPHNASETLLCMDMLRESNHQITLGVIFRYFSKYINSKRSVEDFQEFEAVVKSISSFFILWRATRQGTDGIDSVYKELLKSGCKIGEDIVCSPICIDVCPSNNDLPSPSELSSALNAFLERKLKGPLTKDLFIQKAKSIQTYKNNKGLTRFMLLIASHDVVAEDDNIGLVTKGVKGCNTNFTMDSWRNLRTIEHICPQTVSEGWPDSMSELSSEHVVGNLVLLPQYINSSLGNRSWREKKLIFKMLCSKTESERNALSSEALGNGIELSFSTESIALDANYMEHVEAISNIEEWSIELVEARSINTYSLVWDFIVDWLN